MALRFRLPRPSFAFFLQVAACGVVAWSLWNGGLAGRPASKSIEPPAGAGSGESSTFNPFKDPAADTPFALQSPAPADPPAPAPPGGAAGASAPAAPPAGTAAAVAAIAGAAGTPVRFASAGFDGAQLALSSIDVIVT